MKLGPARRASRTDLDMVPMINVAFLLLIFFLLVGRYGAAEPFRVQPPRAEAAVAPGEAQAVLLLAADGRLGFAGREVGLAELLPAVRAWQQAHPGQVLELKADATAEATELVRLLAQLRTAGLEEVRVLARPPAGQ
jgi:biopolymer transport protein ExbD